MNQATKITTENFHSHFLQFRDRQAGISLVFDAEADRFDYNAYCIEAKLLKELTSVEFEFLEDAITFINEEFGSWELTSFEEEKSGCGTCVAKKP
jgi:hypothetical protein